MLDCSFWEKLSTLFDKFSNYLFEMKDTIPKNSKKIIHEVDPKFALIAKIAYKIDKLADSPVYMEEIKYLTDFLTWDKFNS